MEIKAEPAEQAPKVLPHWISFYRWKGDGNWYLSALDPQLTKEAAVKMWNESAFFGNDKEHIVVCVNLPTHTE